MDHWAPQVSERLLEILPTPVAVSRHGAMLYANGALRRLTGWSREAVVGRPVADVLDPRGLIGPGGLRVPLLVKTVSGAFRGDHASVHVAVAEERDPTPVPGLDLQMVGHDLRKAVGCLRSNLDFSRAQLAALRHHASRAQPETHASGQDGLGPSVHQLETALSDAEAAIDQVASLVRRLEGRGASALQRVRPADLLDEAIRVARRQIGLRVRIVRADHSGRSVDVEFPRMVQALVNLLLNAAQAEGTTTISLSSRDEGHTVCLEVRDDGPGVADAIRDRVFEPGATTRRAAGGSGLGLHIVNQAVRAVHGAVALECPPEGGTRALVRLPAARDDRVPAGSLGTGGRAPGTRAP
jgi:signal transduction histidine kinase